MYISRNKNIKKSPLGLKGQFHFSSPDHPRKISAPNIPKNISSVSRETLDSPHDMLIETHSVDNILSWQSPEFEEFERDRKWYLIITGILLAIVIYAIFMDGLVMAITFILIGAVGYIYIHKEPRILTFMIIKEGIAAGRELYAFENIHSFWILYEPDLSQAEGEQWVKILSLHTKSIFSPYVHIPIHNEDPVLIREILLEFIPEEKHEAGAVEVLSRLLRM